MALNKAAKIAKGAIMMIGYFLLALIDRDELKHLQ